MLAISHERDEVSGLCECGDVIAAAPAVLHEPAVGCWPRAILCPVNDRDADLVAGFVKCLRGISVPLRETVSIADVDVLDIELNAPVVMRLAERDHRLDRSILRDRIGQESAKPRLLEPFVREKRHDLYAVFSCQVGDPLVERAPHYSKAVDDIHLRCHNRDLIDMLHEAVVAVFPVHVIEEALSNTLCLRLGCKRGERKDQWKSKTRHGESHQPDAGMIVMLKVTLMLWAVAVIVAVPGAPPAVYVTLAAPVSSVRVLVALSDPPPLAIAHFTGSFSIDWALAEYARTVSGEATAPT